MQKETKNNIIFSTLSFLILYFLYTVRGILLPFILGIVIAYLSTGITGWLEKKIKSRMVASIVVVGIVFTLILSFFIVIIPILVEHSVSLVNELNLYLTNNSDIISTEIAKFLNFFKIDNAFNFKEYISKYNEDIATYLINLLNSVLSKSIAFISLMALIVVTPITSYYFLKEWNNIIKTIGTFLPTKHTKNIENLFKEIDVVLTACLRGQLNVCIFLGIFYGILLWLGGLKYGFSIGLITGLASFVPYFGMLIGFTISLITSLYQYGLNTMHMAIIISIFGLGQFLEGNIVTPKLVGNKINLHPLWIIFSLFCGGTLFGFVGLLTALPLAGVLGVFIRFFIKKYHRD